MASMTTPAPPSASASRNRTYYAGDLRRDLMDTALAAIVESGPANVSLRDLARRLGVSHAAPKNHFADKRALFTVLATEAHERLADSIDVAVAAVSADDPLRRLVASGRAYLRFAREYPGHFAVMWREDMQDRSDSALLDASSRTFGPLVALGSDVSASSDGALAGHDPVRVALVAWAVAHGIADLSSGGALDDLPGSDDPARRDDEILDLVETVLRGGTR